MQKEFNEFWVWAERQWSKVNKDTGIDNTEFSTSDKGERFFKDVYEKMNELFCAICDADLNDLYENLILILFLPIQYIISWLAFSSYS